MFANLADFILKHSKMIIVIWLVVLLCSVPLAIKSGDVLVYDMTEMGGMESEAVDGQKIVDEYFTNSLNLSEILVISYDSPEELDKAGSVFLTFQSLVKEKYGDKIDVSNYGTYSKDDASKDKEGVMLVAIANNDPKFDIVHETGNLRELVSQAKTEAGAESLTALITGNAAISYDTEASSMEDVSKIDPFSILLIFVLLALFFFAIVTAFIPPAVVGMAYGVVLMLLYAIGSILDIYYITQVLILVSMLGAGCDYAVFIITRYRDECKKGNDHDTALKEAIMWGGEAVFTSGLAVIIGFAALGLCSFSLVQTMGIILALGILMALIAALTFIPALLNLCKDKIFWPSNMEKYRQNEENVKAGTNLGVRGHLSKFSKSYFSWLSRVTHKFAAPIAIVTLLIAAPCVYYYATTEDSADMISVMPPSESVDGLDLIMTQTSGGTIMPTNVVIDLNDSIGEVGSSTILGNEIPYIKWNEKGLNVETMSGAVPALMLVSNDISSKYSIVGTASGINSWAILYTQVAEMLKTDDPRLINMALYSQLPGAVQTPVITILAYASGQSPLAPDPTNLTATPITPIEGTDLVVMNVLDGILNYGTGIIDATATHINMMVITTEEPMSANTMSFIKDLRNAFHGENGYDTQYSSIWSSSYVTGTAALMNDVSSEVEDQFSMIRAVVIVLLIVLLFFILGSYLTPIRAVLTIMLSVIVTVALTRFVFDGLMSTPVMFLIPIVLFVVLLGLGMDYEIFLTTKIRENKIKGMDNHEAIANAIREAGPIISLCALIMGGTFLTMLLAGSSMLQEFGFALGVGILIDGLLMVGFFSPAMMHLMGNWSWKGPGFLTKRHGLNPDGTNMAQSESEEQA